MKEIEPYRVGELYDDIDEKKIECEDDLRAPVLESLLNYGAKRLEDGSYKWERRKSLVVVQEIITDLLTSINRRENHTGTEMTDAELDFTRALRVRFIRVRRAVKNILKQRNEE